MVVAHLDIEVAQVVHLHHKDIVVAVLLHQENLVLHHLCTVPQLTNSIEATAPLITENTKEVRQATTRPLETPSGVNHTGEMQETLEMATNRIVRIGVKANLNKQTALSFPYLTKSSGAKRVSHLFLIH